MVVNRFRPLVLIYRHTEHGMIDDKTTYSYQTVTAHVTEVDGARVQTDLFGKQYNLAWVARIRGNLKPNFIAFPVDGFTNEQLPMFDVIQIRKHATRTDVYFTSDREVNADGLE